MSLTVRLLLLVAVAILPALVIEAYNEFALRQTRTAEVQAQAVRLGEQTAAEMRQIVEGIQNWSRTQSSMAGVEMSSLGSGSV